MRVPVDAAARPLPDNRNDVLDLESNPVIDRIWVYNRCSERRWKRLLWRRPSLTYRSMSVAKGEETLLGGDERGEREVASGGSAIGIVSTGDGGDLAKEAETVDRDPVTVIRILG
ncbi:hypothetical protein Dimus_033794 [Dionaea muscipula]